MDYRLHSTVLQCNPVTGIMPLDIAPTPSLSVQDLIPASRKCSHE